VGIGNNEGLIGSEARALSDRRILQIFQKLTLFQAYFDLDFCLKICSFVTVIRVDAPHLSIYCKSDHGVG